MNLLVKHHFNINSLRHRYNFFPNLDLDLEGYSISSEPLLQINRRVKMVNIVF